MAHRHAQSAGKASLKPTLHLNPLRGGRRAAVHGGVILPALNINQRYSVVVHKGHKERCASLEPVESAAVADYGISVKNNVEVKTADWIQVTVRELKTGTKILCKCVAPKLTRIRDFRKEMFSICGLDQTHAGCGILRMASEHSFLEVKKVQATTTSVRGCGSYASISTERETEKGSDCWGWQEEQSDGGEALSRSWPSPPDEATLDEAWAMSRRQNLPHQGEKKKESRTDASELSMSVLQDRGRQTPKPVLEVLDEDAHTNETRSVVTTVRLGQRTISSKATTQQAKLKPHRTRLKTKSCPVRQKGKLHSGAAIEASEVDNDDDDDRDTMEKQRRKIILLWEYSTLDDDHENLLTLARRCGLPATQSLEAQEMGSEGKRGECSAIAVADAVNDLNHRRNEGCLDSDGASMDHRQGGASAFATWQPSTRSPSTKQAKVEELSIEEEPDHGATLAQDMTAWKKLGLMNGRLYKLDLSQAIVKQAKIEEVAHRAMLAQDMTLWKGLGLINGRVYKLNLSGCQPPLQGSSVIGPEIGLMAELERINFNNNKISGPLPLVECLGRLTQLRQLSISNNRLSGSLNHISVLKNLTNLELSRNAITGSIPLELGSLEQLVALNLSHNKLTDTMPSEMSGLFNLRVLNLSYNKLHGHLKSWVGSLSRLQRIDLGHNRLEGSLPSALTRLGGLEYLHLPHNQLRGGLPMDVLACLNVKIREIFLQGNPLYFVPVETENADMIRKNKYILEDLYSHCNVVFV